MALHLLQLGTHRTLTHSVGLLGVIVCSWCGSHRKGKLLMIVGLSTEFCNDLKALGTRNDSRLITTTMPHQCQHRRCLIPGLPANVPFYESVSEAVDLVNIVVSSSRVA